MCDEHEVPVSGITRRVFLGGVGAVAGSALLTGRTARAATSSTSFSGLTPITAAMHVHGSWSEGAASWEAQFSQAHAIGCDLVFLTDHDFRATAWYALPSMNGIKPTVTSTGSLRQRTVTSSGRTLRLVAESATSTPATLTAAIPTSPTALNRLRTSIAGTVVRHTMGKTTLPSGTTYDVVVTLSYRPATGGRPAGQYSLRYRYGTGRVARSLTGGGLTGVVEHGPTAAGTVDTFDLVSDVASFWPDLFAIDNCMFMVSFVATSPRSGAVADVGISDVSFVRTGHSPSDVVQQQSDLVGFYAPRFPSLRLRPTVEISRYDPHINVFGVPQAFPVQSSITANNKDAFYQSWSDDVRSRGGLVSWNHAFGANVGPLLSAADQAAKRRTVFADMLAKNLFGAEILEVGYSQRGSVIADTHVALWDTFSRRAIFLTGNGVNDDHAGQNWATLSNGWTTGIWSASSDDSDTTPALRSGRAYTSHAGRWPGGTIDLLVDDTIPMGKVAVRNSGTSRSLAISAGALPSGSTVEIVRGPVDGGGNDPGTSVPTRLAASRFTGSGVVAQDVDTTTSCFVRAQVRNSAGALIGTSNPVWLLRSTPSGGIPTGRTV